MFLIGSTLLFGAHLPFLDRAESKRKEILTAGRPRRGTDPPEEERCWPKRHR